MQLSDLDVALAAARVGATVVRDGFGTGTASELKGSVNPVTEVDRRAEAATLGLLREERPADRLLAEEGGGTAAWDRGRVWIIDPLDGTVNFVHQIPQVAVSVALWEDGEPRVGVVVDALRGETFAAEGGEGATLDGDSIQVSTVDEPSDGLVATGFPYDRQEHAAAYSEVVAAVLERFQGIRRIGSAALDLCWLACGRFDGYWEYGLSPWDTAAAALIVTEAGGVVTAPDGSPFDLSEGSLVAATPPLHPVLRETVWELHPAHLR